MCPTLGPGVLDDSVKWVCVSLMHPDSIAVSAPISPTTVMLATVMG